LGKVQIDCIRCLKLYELNNETVNPKIGMEKVSWKAPEKNPQPRKKAPPPVEQPYQPDYHDEVETSKRSSPLTYIISGLILLAFALFAMMMQ
jgi:hypothetical protein